MKRSNPYKAVIPIVSGIAYVPNPRPHPEQPLEVTVRSERIGTLGRDLAPGVRLISQISQTEKEVWVTHGEERLFVLLQDGLGRSSYFYQSFSGTGGKAQGAWFPSGGILADRQGRGVWVIKGSPKTDPGAGRAALLELYEKANAVLPQSDADTDRFVKKLTGVGFDEDFTYKDAYAIKPVLRILEDGSARDLQAKWGSWSYQFWALNALDKTFGKRTFNMKSNPEDLAGRHIPDRYLAGLPPALQKQRVRELTESRDAYKRGDYSELLTDVTARKMGLVKESAYTTVAKRRGIEWKGNAADMADRVLTYYGVRSTPALRTDLTEALNASFKKGLAAWKSGGHRPGATAQNWAVARVNSLVVGGKTAWTADRKQFLVLPPSAQDRVIKEMPQVLKALQAQGRQKDVDYLKGVLTKENPLTSDETQKFVNQYPAGKGKNVGQWFLDTFMGSSAGAIRTAGSASTRNRQVILDMAAEGADAAIQRLYKLLDEQDILDLMKLDEEEREGDLGPESQERAQVLHERFRAALYAAKSTGYAAARKQKSADQLGMAMDEGTRVLAERFAKKEAAAKKSLRRQHQWYPDDPETQETDVNIAREMELTLQMYNTGKARYQKPRYSKVEDERLEILGSQTMEEARAQAVREIELALRIAAVRLAAAETIAEKYPYKPGTPPPAEVKALRLLPEYLSMQMEPAAAYKDATERSGLTRLQVQQLYAAVGQQAQQFLDRPEAAEQIAMQLGLPYVGGPRLLTNRGRR